MSKDTRLNSQVEAKGFSRFWGTVKVLLGQVVFYATMVNMLMIAATAYNTTIREWTIIYLGFELNFLAFLGIIGLVLLLALVFEYKVTLPGFFGFTNQQQYKHDNPIRRDLEEIKERLIEIEKATIAKKVSRKANKKVKVKTLKA